MSALVVDCGASSTKWAALESDGSIKRGNAAYLTGHIFNDDEWRRVKEIIDGIAKSAPTVSRAIFGITGLEKGTPIAERIIDIARSALGVEEVEVRNDMELAHAALFQPGEGILIYGGTGSVAVSRDKSGELIRAGGYGFIIGDEGGGFWIGREALRHVTELWDLGKDPQESILGNQILSAASPQDWNGLREYVYKGGRQAVAALAPIVGEAVRAGSAEAREILVSAGNHLAELTKRLLTRVPTSQFAAMGGVFKLDSILIESLTTQLGYPVEYIDDDIPERWLRNHSQVLDEGSGR